MGKLGQKSCTILILGILLTPFEVPPHQTVQAAKPANADQYWQRALHQEQRGHYPAALKIYREALVLYQTQQNSDRIRQARLKIGQMHNALHESEQALPVLQQALKTVPKNVIAEADILTAMGAAHFNLEQYQQASPLLDKALAQYRQHRNPTGAAKVLSLQGAIHSDQGEYKQAETALKQALELHGAERYDITKTLMRLGFLYQQTDQLDLAQATLQNALEIAQAIGNQDSEGRTLNLLGIVYYKGGEFKQALHVQQQALKRHRKTGNRAKELNALQLLAITHSGLGNHDQAAQLFQDTLELARLRQDHKAEHRTLKLLAYAYQSLPDYARMVETVQTGLAIARQLNQQTDEVELLGMLSFAHSRQGQLDLAIRFGQRSLALAEQLQKTSLATTALAVMGEAYSAQGNNPKALEVHLKQLAIVQQQQDPVAEVINLLTVGSTYTVMGQNDEARKRYQQALTKAIALKTMPKHLPDLRDRALYGLSLTYLQVGELDPALKLTQERLAWVRSLKDPPLEAAARIDLGKIYTFQQQFPQAMEQLEQGLTLARQLKAVSLETKALNELSDTLAKQGQHKRSIELATQSLTLAQRLNDLQQQADALKRLSDSHKALGENDRAIAFAQQRVQTAQQRQHQGLILAAQTDLSQAYLAAGKTEQAKILAKQVLTDAQQFQSRPLQIAPLTLLCQVYRIEGQFEQAIEAGEKSLALARQVKSTFGESAALNELGRVYIDLGDYAQVVKLVEPNVALAQKQGNRSLEAAAVLLLGQSHQVLGQYRKATDVTQQGLTLARKLQNRPLEIEALATLGSLSHTRRNYRQALRWVEQSLALANRTESPAAFPQTILGDIYQALGDYATAIRYRQASLANAQARQSRQSEGLMRVLLSQSYVGQGDSQTAVQQAQQGLTIFRQLKRPLLEAVALLSLGTAYGDLGQTESALQAAGEGLAIANQLQNARIKQTALSLIARLQAQQGDQESAIASYQQALTIETEARGGLAYLQAGLARLYREQQQPLLAIAYYKQSIQGIEAIRATVQGLPPELQSSFLEAVVDFKQFKTADIYRQLADLLLSEGRLLEAQQVLELLKGKELQELSRSAQPAPSPTPLTSIEADILKEHGSLMAFAQQVKHCQESNCARLSQLLDQRDALTRQFNQRLTALNQKIRQQRSQDDAFLDPRQRGNVRQIVEAQPGTILIYPLVLDDKVWLLATFPGGVLKSIEVKGLSRQKLGQTVLEFRQLLQTPTSDIAKVKATGQQLYDWLLKPLASELDAKQVQNLVFSLDRTTRYIPMGALFDGERYLVEKYSISSILSAAVTDFRDRLRPDNTSVLALGLSEPIAGFNPLPNVPSELDAIVREPVQDPEGIYPGQTFLNKAFTFRALRDHLFNHRVLHIATHGQFLAEQPDRSFLLMGTGEPLTIPQIETLQDLGNVHLVVLSACETALGGPDQDGREINALSYYFLNGGAEAVMASLWLVSDASTSQLMQRFYGNLAQTQGMTKAEALRQAQLDMLQDQNVEGERRGAIAIRSSRKTASAWSHPYYWAPFTLIGNSL